MKKILNNLLFIILIISLGFIIFIGIIICEKEKEIKNMSNQEMTINVNVRGLNPKKAMQVMEDINNIDGVTLSNTKYEEKSEENGADTIIIDEIYYNKFKSNLKLEQGTNFSSEDFTYIFDDTFPIPILISSSYAQLNKLKVGDEIDIVQPDLTNICSLYSTSVSYKGTTDGSVIENISTDFSNQCVHDEKFDYLMNSDGEYNLPVVVKGILSPTSEIPGFNEKEFKNFIVMPYFVVDNVNIKLYDMEKYLNHEPLYVYANSNVLGFVDYEVISSEKFDNEINNINNKYGINIAVDREIDNKTFLLQTQMKMYNQIIIILLFISLLLLIFWTTSIFYKTKNYEYELVIYNLFGVDILKFVMIKLKKELLENIIIASIIELLGITLSLLFNYNIFVFMLLIIFLVLKIIEYIYLYIKCYIVLSKNISKIYIRGE